MSLALLSLGLVGVIAVVAASPLVIDTSATDQMFYGIGGLSGGGATTRLLVDYPAQAQSDILDYLFTPNFGASLHILKVEIGGDSQSTDGTESSHMHTADTVDYNTGYEWWLMTEAKKRNPDIKLYGLPWAFPGWVGEGSGSPYQYPNLTASYVTKWVQGAKSVYDLDIDYIGVWNERNSDATYVETLRQYLDNAGFTNTKIVAKDGDSGICNDLANDPAYAKAVDIVGLHYPSDFDNYDECHNLNKPLWASEESSSYDDLNGAACWARVITSHWSLSRMTASIMWNLVGSYFHGTNWFASSHLTAVEPWSGHYEINPVIWASAHVTQFTQPGWFYLKNNSGSGVLPNGGYYATLTDPSSKDFTLTVAKISHDHAPCTRPSLPFFNVSGEVVTFQLPSSGPRPARLAVWYSNFENYTANAPLFSRLADIAPAADGTFTLSVPVGAFYTVSTITSGPTKGAHVPPPSVPQFPLPYSDDFQGYAVSQEPRWLSDQIGAFEMHADADNATAPPSLLQMVPQLPIGWSDHGSNGPVSVVGMREWQDITVTVTVKLPASVTANTTAGCVATRSDQSWFNGIAFCVYSDQSWTLSIGGPSQQSGVPLLPIAKGKLATPVVPGTWHEISLTTLGGTASATLDGAAVFANQKIRDLDTGFAAFGTNAWYPVRFGRISIAPAGPNWGPLPSCMARAGQLVSIAPCASNGRVATGQQFALDPNWGLRHIPSGLCVAASSVAAGAKLTLQPCAATTDPRQQFRNDYTSIRNNEVPVTVGSLLLVANASGATLAAVTPLQGLGWGAWTYFPNTQQLRNQYVANVALGYPMCLAAC